MGRITKKYAESLAEEISEKLNNISSSKNNTGIVLESNGTLSKDTLVKTILNSENIYLPLKRITQFENLQDETVKNLCNPAGKITMTEVFNKGYKPEELLNMDITSLDVHCEGIENKGVVSYVTPWTNRQSNDTSSDFGKDYAVTYEGEGTDGSIFLANAVYNTVNPNKKEYSISKTLKDSSTGKIKAETSKVSSTGKISSSEGYNDTKTIKIGRKNYIWNHFEGVTTDSLNKSIYSWEDSIKESSGSTISNTICKYDNSNYDGTAVEITATDFTTGSEYKESDGIIKSATGTLSIVCKYDLKGNVLLEKPTFTQITKGTKMVEVTTSPIDETCLGVVSIKTNIATSTEEIVISPNPAVIKENSDVLKIVDALKKWNIGSNSISASNNNIWVNTNKGNAYFTEDGSYVVNNFSTLGSYLTKK